MKPLSLTNRTLNGFLWLFTGKGTQAVLQIVILVVLARLLTPAEFGVVGAALVIVGFSQIFSELGVGPAIVQRAKLSQTHMRVGFTLSLILSCLTGIVIMLSAPLFVAFFRMPELKSVVQVLALIFPITGPSIVAEALLQREMQFKQLTIIRLVSYTVGYGAVGIVLAAIGWGVWALVFAQLGQALINSAIFLLLKREVIGLTLQKKELKQLLNFGTGLSLAKIANYAARQIDNLVVGRWLGAEALGIYGRAYQFMMTPTNLFGSIMNQVLFPAMASVQDEKERLARAYTRALAVIAMFTLPLSGIFIVLAPEIVMVLLGTQWEAVVLPFQILAAVLLFRTSYKISDSLVRALGAVYRSAWRQWVYATAVSVGAWTGHFWGLGGVALGVSLALCLHFTLMLQLSIAISGASWVEIGRIHLRHILIGLLVTGATLGFASTGRFYGLADILVLIGGILMAGLTILLILGFNSRFFGDEGDWVYSLAKKQLKTAVNFAGPAKHDSPTTKTG
jgi:O-antigen/teichoic acid export membrane protein